MTSNHEEFDGYRKWLGISEKRRPPTHYVLLAISIDEDDADVIRAAAEQRRNFVESKRGGGHDSAVAEILYRISEAEVTLLNPEMRREYDRRMNLFEKRRKSRRIDPHAERSRVESRPGRTAGEGSGLVGTFLGVMAVLMIGVGLMAWFSFHLPWRNLQNTDEGSPEMGAGLPNAPVALAATASKQAPEKTPAASMAAVPHEDFSAAKAPPATSRSLSASNSDHVLRGHTAEVTHVAVSPDGQYISSGSNDHSVRLWDRQSGREVWKVSNLNSGVFALSFSPEGNRLWVATKDSAKRLDTSSGAESKGMPVQLCNESLLGGVSFGLGCARIAVSGKGWVRVYDNSRQQETAFFDNAFVPCVAFSRSGGEVFFGGNEGDGNVRLLKVADKKQVSSFTGLRDRTIALRISDDGRLLAASSGPAQPKQRPSQNKITVWEISSGRLLQEFRVDSWQYGLAFSPDGLWLATGGGGSEEDWMGHRHNADRSVTLWDLRSGKELQRFSGHTAAVRALEFTPSGNSLVSGGADSTVRIWQLEQD
jgi:hypothetical protein